MKDCIVNLVLNLYALFLKVQPTGLASVLPVQAPTPVYHLPHKIDSSVCEDLRVIIDRIFSRSVQQFC